MVKKSREMRSNVSIPQLKIRPEKEEDFAKITEVNDLAFEQKNEGRPAVSSPNYRWSLS